MSTPRFAFLFPEPEKRRSWKQWLSLGAVVLVPLFVSGILIAALWNPADRLDTMKAAIVNNDKPVTVNGQLTPLGRQFAAELIKTQSIPNYTWVITDEEDAQKGLSNGTYTAAITVPESFSADATSVAGDSPKQAHIDVATSEKGKIIDTATSQILSETAARVTGQQITTNYVKNVADGFGTLKSSLGQAASGATDLSNGANQLATGADSLKDGSDQLANGLNEMDQNTQALPGQVGQLSSGAEQAAEGATTLQSALEQQSNGLSALAQACPPTAGEEYCTQVAQAAAGAGQISQQSGSLSSGLSELSTGLGSLSSGIPTLTQGISQSAAGAGQLSSGAEQLSTGAHQLHDGSTKLADGLHQATNQIPSNDTKSSASLPDVVAAPVTVSGLDVNSLSTDIGKTSTPFYMVLALWIGALSTFLLFRSLPRTALNTTKSPLKVALTAFLPVGAIGALQGLLVALILQPQLKLDAGHWIGMALISILVGIAFIATNQALMAVFGKAGRFVSLLVVVLVVATSIVSAIPSLLNGVATFLPTGQGVRAFTAVIHNASDMAGAITGLVLWTIGSLLVTTFMASRRRKVSARKLATDGYRDSKARTQNENLQGATTSSASA